MSSDVQRSVYVVLGDTVALKRSTDYERISKNYNLIIIQAEPMTDQTLRSGRRQPVRCDIVKGYLVYCFIIQFWFYTATLDG